jgi:hypothetical protein
MSSQLRRDGDVFDYDKEMSYYESDDDNNTTTTSNNNIYTNINNNNNNSSTDEIYSPESREDKDKWNKSFNNLKV